jgi:hypothetical protein
MSDRFETLRRQLEAAVITSPGETDPAVRRRAMRGEGDSPALTAFLQRVREHAYRVTDEEVAALTADGHSDDQLFELLLAAALGASQDRLEAGLSALEGGARAAPQGR